MKFVIICLLLAFPTVNSEIFRPRRQVISDGKEAQLWHVREIPYVVDFSLLKNNTYAKEVRNNLHEAFSVLQRLTCLSFVDKSNESPQTRQAIADKSITVKYNPDPKVLCDANPGKQVEGLTVITVSDRCSKDQLTLIHEVLHVLGVLHVQMRKDRENYIYVFRHKLGPFQPQFEIVRDAQLFDVPYNPGSIMHYVPQMKSKRKGGETPPFGPLANTMSASSFSNNRLTYTDIKVVNLAYNCPAQCSEDDQDRCSNNEGIVDSRNCETCHCPDIYEGPMCNKRRQLKVNGKDCGATLRATDKWKTLKASFNASGACVWHIRGQDGAYVQVKVNKIDSLAEKRSPPLKRGEGCERFCMDGYLDVQTDDFQVVGTRFCCNNIPGNIQTITTPSDFIALMASFTMPFGFELQYRYTN